MIKFLQFNAHLSSASQDLADLATLEQNIDIWLISEPNVRTFMSNKPGWFIDDKLKAGIKISRKNLWAEDTGHGQGFVWIMIENCQIFSCYISPNTTEAEYTNYLEQLKYEIRNSKYHQILLGGDFNAKSQEWGSDREDRKGTLLSQWITELGLVIVNQGNKPTFVRGNTSSNIDITLCSRSLSRKIKNWRVSDEENLSDHENIYFQLIFDNNQNPGPSDKDTAKWRYDDKKKDKFKEVLKKILNTNDPDPKQCTLSIQKAAEKVFGNKEGKSHRKPVYWWNEEISNLRILSHQKKRKMVRTNKTRHVSLEEKNILRREYYKSKDKLRIAINLSKRKAWENLCTDLNRNIWGNAYKIVCKKFKIATCKPLTTEEKIEEAAKLFPRHEKSEWDTIESDEGNQPFSLEELVEAVHKMRNKKAPGADGVTSELVKALFEIDPNYCLSLFNKSWISGSFPSEWKIAKLVLIEKGKKDSQGNMTYRPICLLNVLGKVMEHLIKARLTKEMREKGVLADTQFGFREGRSTLDAMKVILGAAEEAKKRGKLCAMTMVDVRNAFNSMPWKGIIDELKRKNISGHITKVLGSYFEDRKLEIDDVTIDLTCGCPQGSVLSPTLWNIYYDPVLRLQLPENTKIIGYADDLVIVTEGRSRVEIETTTNKAMKSVIKWMEEAQLQVAPEKTEVVLLVSKRMCREITVKVGNVEVMSKKSAKYLGVVFDENLRMTEHIKYVTSKAQKVIGMLSKIMPNIKGPDNPKRKILATVVYSTLLYGVPAWGKVTKWKKYVNLLQQIQRKVMARLCRSYRTTSTAALQVISGSLPIEMMIEEKMKICEIVKEEENRDIREEKIQMVKNEMAIKWRMKWINGDDGKWTKRLIKDMDAWVNRQHGDISYELCQFLTGHGHFRTFQFKIKKERTENCRYCQDIKDTPEHTIFHCSRFTQIREECQRKEGHLTAENVIEKMLSSLDSWKNIENMVKNIINVKEKNERRQRSTSE